MILGASMIALHPRLSSDCHHLGLLDVCQVLLMDDCTYPWVILVPDRDGMRDFHDLDVDDHLGVMRDITTVSRALEAMMPLDKINVAALGNQVPQLHIHVIGRKITDPAWPGPVWGVQQPEPYQPAALDERISILRELIGLRSAD